MQQSISIENTQALDATRIEIIMNDAINNVHNSETYTYDYLVDISAYISLHYSHELLNAGIIGNYLMLHKFNRN